MSKLPASLQPTQSKLEKDKEAEEEEGERPRRQTLPPERCPRCESLNTKFCYYNNYSLAQPRYFCKTCRRYWTKGGALRNVPFGGSCRRGKRMQTSPYERLSLPQNPMQPHLVLGTNIPIAAMLSCNEEERSPQLSMAYDGFGAIGAGYYGHPPGNQDQPLQVVQPSLFATAMLGTYGGSAGEATHAGSTSGNALSRDEHRRLGAGAGVGLATTGGRYPSLLPSPYFDKNLYFVKDV